MCALPRYFLVGQLTDPEILGMLLGYQDLPPTRNATAEGLSTVCNQYCAGLVLDKKRARVSTSRGSAYLVINKLEEDRLRYFHTNLRKVIRCNIMFDPFQPNSTSIEVQGLTFVLDPGRQNELQLSPQPNLPHPDLDAFTFIYTPDEGYTPENSTEAYAREGNILNRDGTSPDDAHEGSRWVVLPIKYLVGRPEKGRYNGS